LITPTVYNALRYARPPSGIRHYRFPMSYWKHFEQLPRLPHGVLPVADALCRFNPIDGQGMSSATKQARLLQDVLGRTAGEADPIAAVQMRFMGEVASVLETSWNISTSADLAFPETRGERSENFAEAQEFEAALPRRRRRRGRPSRDDGSRPTAAAAESIAGTADHATDQGGF
jgi:hypothetical protein